MSWRSACRPPCPRRSSWTTNGRRRSHSTAWISDDDAPFGRLCLAARRMVERGVRFVQIFHGGGGGGAWDAHARIKANHSQLSAQVDLPIAGLLKDLKQRGLLDETIVVWGTEFGRSPGAQADGRDHHPAGLLCLAGRRRHQRRRRPRRDRRDRLPRRRRSALRHRHPRHGPAPARPRSAQARGSRPQTARDRLRAADPGDHRVTVILTRSRKSRLWDRAERLSGRHSQSASRDLQAQSHRREQWFVWARRGQ